MINLSASLDTVLMTHELASRFSRPTDFDSVNEAFGKLQMANLRSPEAILQRFAEILIDLCSAHSAGVSILEGEKGKEVFRWHAIAGLYAPYRWGTMSRYASPCGFVVNQEAVQLFKYPERFFPYSIPLNPPICEALLTPFHLNGNVIGTAWLISHQESRRFDNEDLRRMQNFLWLTAVAYDLALNTK